MEDQILAALRRIREAHAAQFNFDLDARFADFKRLETEEVYPSSLERLVAIPTASIKAARTPDCSNDAMAAMVVPAGVVTISRNWAGCLPVVITI